MTKGISERTGDAKIDRQGHTANAKFGADPQMKGVSRPDPRDLRP